MCVYIQWSYAFPLYTHTHTHTQNHVVSWSTLCLVCCSVHEVLDETITAVERIFSQTPANSRPQYDCRAHCRVSTTSALVRIIPDLGMLCYATTSLYAEFQYYVMRVWYVKPIVYSVLCDIVHVSVLMLHLI